jgi:hypothetical protein
MVSDHHVIVDFGSGIPSEAQGPVMLAMERSLREQGIPAEVFKPTKADDSKLRSRMTIEERAKL